MAPAAELRLLILGHSGDLIDLGAPIGNRVAQLQQRVEDMARVPVRVRWARAHPGPGLSRHVARVLADFEPDIVVLHASGDYVAAEYVGAFLESVFDGRLRPLVRSLAKFTLRLLDSEPRYDETGKELRMRRALYYAGRNALLRIGLGRTFVSVDDAAAAHDAAISVIAAREGTILAVRGPTGQLLPHYPPRLNREAMERLAALDGRLREICARRQVPFGSPIQKMCGDPARYLLPDGYHSNAEGQALTLEIEAELLRPLLD